MIPIQVRNCGACRHYQPTSQEAGDCRGNPPLVVPWNRAVWATVGASDPACARFSPANPGNQPRISESELLKWISDASGAETDNPSAIQKGTLVSWMLEKGMSHTAIHYRLTRLVKRGVLGMGQSPFAVDMARTQWVWLVESVKRGILKPKPEVEPTLDELVLLALVEAGCSDAGSAITHRRLHEKYAADFGKGPTSVWKALGRLQAAGKVVSGDRGWWATVGGEEGVPFAGEGEPV